MLISLIKLMFHDGMAKRDPFRDVFLMAKINRAPTAPHDGNALWARSVSEEGLASGWEKVRQNDGAAGGDCMTCRAFSLASQERLADLRAALVSGSYRPGPLRRIDIAKPDGGKRTLAIPCVADRVAQSSVAQALTPLFEAEFEDISFGYRPGRSVKQALQRVQALREEGFVWTVDADIEAYFDNVPHDRLLDRFARSVSAGPLTDLLALWLESGMENGRGLAQGSPLSPLLANLYLDGLDEALLGSSLRTVRFADDFVILTKARDGAEKALEQARDTLAQAGLALHPEKTRIRSYDEATKYLGAVFVRSFVMRDPGKPELGEIETVLADIARRDREQEEADEKASATAAQERDAGLNRGLKTLYVHGSKRRLALKNLAFAVMQDEGADAGGSEVLLAAIHPTRLDRIEIGPDSDVTGAALRNALAFGIEVAFVNGHHEVAGTLTGPLPDRARRHLAQARHVLDPHLRVELARRFVAGRIANQRALLRRINYRRGLEEVTHVILALGRHLRVLDGVDTIEKILGVEGAATERFWRGYSALFMHGWSLPARRRRPAPDPVNSALNAAVSLLERDMRVIIESVGLHPGFGFLHTATDGRDAAVYDLMEVFRAPVAESVVIDLFNSKILRAEHFEKVTGGHRMDRHGFSAIIRAYEERAENRVQSKRDGRKISWRSVMREQAEDLAAHFEGRRTFAPYVIGA
jgi:CRISP-associated protein Cas1